MYFRLNRSLFRFLFGFLRVGFMRFGDLLVFSRDFWGYVILGFGRDYLVFVRMVVAKILGEFW